jgi:hypothetical protein
MMSGLLLRMVMSVCTCWFHSTVTLPTWPVSADFGTCSYQSSLSNFTPSSLHILKCISARALSCHYYYYYYYYYFCLLLDTTLRTSYKNSIGQICRKIYSSSMSQMWNCSGVQTTYVSQPCAILTYRRKGLYTP